MRPISHPCSSASGLTSIAPRLPASDDVATLVDDRQQALGRSPECLRLEVPVERRLVPHSKRCPAGTELADGVLMIVRAAEAVDLSRVECRLVELDRLATAADRELYLDPSAPNYPSGSSARAASRSREACSLSAVVARARAIRDRSVSSVQS
jgi:hypothetical protein